jgi:tripartite-type tricarboxylate transporter receptor subunit TctC
MKQSLMRSLVLAAAALLPFAAASADFPQRPIKLIVPYPPGSSADNAMRVVAPRMADILKQPILIESRPGVPGIQAAALAPADGHTLLMGANSALVTHPLMDSKLVYKPKDFASVGRVLLNQPVLVVHSSVPARSVKELVALARQKPGVLNYGSSSLGGPNHLSMELFQQMTGTQLVHVPYKGGAPAVQALTAGITQTAIFAVTSVMPAIRGGKLVPLAVMSGTRSRMLPEVPTIAEAGLPGCEYDIWYGLFAPAKTPPAVIQKINGAMLAALRDPAVIKSLHEQGAEPAPSTPQELATFVQQDTAQWSKIIRERKLQID